MLTLTLSYLVSTATSWKRCHPDFTDVDPEALVSCSRSQSCQYKREPKAQPVFPKASALVDALLLALGVRRALVPTLPRLLLASLLLPLLPAPACMHHSFIPNLLPTQSSEWTAGWARPALPHSSASKHLLSTYCILRIGIGTPPKVNMFWALTVCYAQLEVSKN